MCDSVNHSLSDSDDECFRTSVLKLSHLENSLDRICQTFSLWRGLKLRDEIASTQSNLATQALVPIAVHPEKQTNDLLAFAILRVHHPIDLNATTTSHSDHETPAPSVPFWTQDAQPFQPRDHKPHRQLRSKTAVLIECCCLCDQDDDQNQSRINEIENVLSRGIEHEMRVRGITNIHYLGELIDTAPQTEQKRNRGEPYPSVQRSANDVPSMVHGTSTIAPSSSEPINNERCQPWHLGFQFISNVQHMEAQTPLTGKAGRGLSHSFPMHVANHDAGNKRTIRLIQANTALFLSDCENPKIHPAEKTIVNAAQPHQRFELVAHPLDWDSHEERIRFCQLVQETYVESKDCFSKNNLVSAAQTLDDYRSSKTFAPNGWLMIRETTTGNDIGCFILSHSASPPSLDSTFDTESAFENVVEIVYLGLLPSFRRQGLGYVLLALIEQYSQSLHCQRILLTVDTCNQPAIQLYRQAGFRDLERESLWSKHLANQEDESIEGTRIVDVKQS